MEAGVSPAAPPRVPELIVAAILPDPDTREAVLGDLTNATQQARALSRDVDGAIAAASEVKQAIEP